jgi:adenine-specific DNA-methyltransferase
MQNLLTELQSLLVQDQRFVIDGNLFKNKIVECVLNLDEGLIALLLKSETIKKHFFTKVGDVLVFDKIKFQKFVSNKQFLPDSYTAFKNQIGLVSGDDYISDSKDVVLAWAYKDCVLEGGQTKEEQKRNEIFWNETLAPDEIDRLLSPKVFTNFKRHTKNGVEEITELHDNENYIIKGNNLMALHSLDKVFGEKIKMIYIDPPYNTGSDGFNYNDSFNHSTWLTFMKNRLTVAQRLLTKDGIIFISCDDREFAYLKVLTDEIFGRENFITSLIWRKKAGGGNDSTDIAVEHEYILTYRKKTNGIYKIPLNKEALKNYKYSDSKVSTHGKYCTKDLNDPSLQDSQGLHFDIKCPDGSILKGSENQWKCTKETFLDRLNDDRIIFKQINGEYKVHYKIYLNEEKGKLKYDKNGNIIQKGRNLSSILYDVALNKEGNQNLKEMFDNEYPFDYPKPVNLIKTLIRVATKDSDYVLDFFAGSGTTAQAILEVNDEDETSRKFILVEQMDYVKTVTAQRIKNFLTKKNCDSNFIYLELKEIYADLIVKIQKANGTEEINRLSSEIRTLLDKFNIEYSQFDVESFENFDLGTMKKIVFDMIDKNQYYVPLSEINDRTYQISSMDKSLNKYFYQLKI